MAITNIPEISHTAKDASYQIRRMFLSTLKVANSNLRRVRGLVKLYGRSAIAAELGSDAAALLSVYNSLKDAIEAGIEITVEDLP